MKHYVATDLHGDCYMYDQMMSYLEGLDEDFILYFLGDAADRGRDGYFIINYLLNDKRVVYLKGNHEDLFVRAAREYVQMALDTGVDKAKFIKFFDYNVAQVMEMDATMKLYKLNDGLITFRDWIEQGCPMTLINRLDKLPLRASWGKYDMCHAGCSLEEWEDVNEEAMLWDRTHFTKPWKRSRILIHGHTPIKYLPGTKDWRIKSYANGHKYDLDTACWQTGILNIMCLEDESIITLLRDENITLDFQ